MPPAPHTAKLTSTLHLLIPRLRLLQKKSTASSVVQRRELAQLLENHRDASARIRVENVITTDIAVEVMEMVELYCELLLARAGVLDGLAFGEAGQKMRGRVREEMGRQTKGSGPSGADGAKKEKGGSGGGGGGGFFGFFGRGTKQPSQQPQTTSTTTTATPAQNVEQEPDSEVAAAAAAQGEDTGATETYYLDAALDEASVAIFYAWSRFPTEVRELTLLRSLLADRYGKDFMSLASENKLAGVKVPERLVKGLRVRPPSKELVESYLREIARAYKVPWGEEDQELEAGPQFVDEDVGGDLGGPGDEHESFGEVVRRASETAELTRATPPRGFNAHSSPVSVAPPGPRSDNPNPRVKVPDEKGKGGDEISPSPSPSAQRARIGAGDKSGIPDVDELSRRFAALKR
ncbi:regulator of Vps4 activity in the MVB pathway-domain-containing protein [Aspergillus nidulans var. acristatus]